MSYCYTILICLCLIGLGFGLPTIQSDTKVTTTSSYASDASQIIALNLLKSNVDIDGNQVHSPLGVTSLLAVLAEAAAGETYDEFVNVFGYPKERNDLRTSFQRILGKYHSKDYGNHPSFQTWLYIYRNNTAREDFKQILRDYYFVEVKDISREEYDWNVPSTSISADSLLDSGDGITTTTINDKDVVGFETLKLLSPESDKPAVAAALAAAPVAKAAAATQDTFGEEMKDKEASKFDRVVDDKQYVEKPVIIEEMKKQTEAKKEVEEAQKEQKEMVKATEKELEKIETTCGLGKPENSLNLNEKNKREEDANPIENETVLEDEKLFKTASAASEQVIPIEEVLKSNEPEKVSIPLQKLESALDEASKDAGEIMVALESHISNVRRLYGARSLIQKEDIASALSANSITGRKAGSKTKMLLFNGLYHRGHWKNLFAENVIEKESFFYMTPEDAVKTPMMRTKGKFRYADLEHLNARLICLPYQGDKYGMVIILPKDIEGLHSVIEKIQKSDFDLAYSKLKAMDLNVLMPKFQSEETSRSEAMLKNLGLTKLFSREEADLSFLTEDRDLHVDELVQFVTLRVDEGGSSENSLSASMTITEGRTNGETTTTEVEKYEAFEINRPFLYFVMDLEEKFVIASGKIYKPEYKKEESLAIEIELDSDAEGSSIK